MLKHGGEGGGARLLLARSDPWDDDGLCCDGRHYMYALSSVGPTGSCGMTKLGPSQQHSTAVDRMGSTGKRAEKERRP